MNWKACGRCEPHGILISVEAFFVTFLSRMTSPHKLSALLYWSLQSSNWSNQLVTCHLTQLVRDFNMFQFCYYHSLSSAEFYVWRFWMSLSFFKYVWLLTWHGTSIGKRWFVISIIFKQLKIKISLVHIYVAIINQNKGSHPIRTQQDVNDIYCFLWSLSASPVSRAGLIYWVCPIARNLDSSNRDVGKPEFARLLV